MGKYLNPGNAGFQSVLKGKYIDKTGLIELKWNKSPEGAIAQIKDKQYLQVIEDFGREVLLVGINYETKNKTHSCVIEKYHRKPVKV